MTHRMFTFSTFNDSHYTFMLNTLMRTMLKFIIVCVFPDAVVQWIVWGGCRNFGCFDQQKGSRQWA